MYVARVCVAPLAHRGKLGLVVSHSPRACASRPETGLRASQMALSLRESLRLRPETRRMHYLRVPTPRSCSLQRTGNAPPITAPCRCLGATSAPADTQPMIPDRK
jgi:hypothetical protein